MPTSADLDDPLGFASAERDDRAADDDFDAALAELLERDDDEGPADDDPR